MVGCAQLPTPGTVSTTPLIDFSECGVSVGFSGNPAQIPESDLQPLLKGLGEYAKWNATAWRFSKYRLGEYAVCICREYTLTFADMGEPKGWIPVEKSEKILEGIGAAAEYQQDRSADERIRMQIVYIFNPDRCVVMQVVTAPEPGIASRSFFSSLGPPSNVTRRSMIQAPAMPVADRLRQLEQLLKDHLITPDEYARRRRVVLESL